MEKIEALENEANEICNEWLDECNAKGINAYFGISKKMAGIIYRQYKLGNLNLTKEEISALYDEANVYYKSQHYNQDPITVDYYVSAFQACLKNNYKVCEYCLKMACHWAENI